MKPENLPPTVEAAEQHILRAYLQWHDWERLNTMTLPVEEYGWEVSQDGSYTPIGTTKDVAPAQLLKLTACNCKMGCKHHCSCESAGLKCIQACRNCHGMTCDNTKTP